MTQVKKSSIPDDILLLLENKLSQVTHGSVYLEIKKHDNRICWAEVSDKIRIVPDTPMSGTVHGR